MDKDEKLLPEPHDMLLPATEENLASGNKQSSRSFLHRFSAIQWQLIIVLIVILLTTAIFIATSRRDSPTVTEILPTMTPVITQIPTDIPSSAAAETDDWTSFSYTNNGQKINLKYPPGLKVNTSSKTSAINPSEKVPTVIFSDADTTITFTFEENTGASLVDWVGLYGTKQATSPAEFNNRQAIIQYTADKQNINAYLEFDKDTVLWTRSTTRGNDAKQFETLLNTLTIGK